jgi:hypothetical protein
MKFAPVTARTGHIIFDLRSMVSPHHGAVGYAGSSFLGEHASWALTNQFRRLISGLIWKDISTLTASSGNMKLR